MSKFRVWYGDKPNRKKVSSLKEAIKFILKNSKFDESNSGIEQGLDGDWDEWLDDDDQNIHEHLFMYESRSKYLRDDDDDDDYGFDDDSSESHDDDDMEERLMKVIGGNSKVSKDDGDFDDDDDADEEEDFDEELIES